MLRNNGVTFKKVRNLQIVLWMFLSSRGNTIVLVIYSRYQDFRQVIMEWISEIPTPNMAYSDKKALFMSHVSVSNLS
jgi:hypothetical protein